MGLNPSNDREYLLLMSQQVSVLKDTVATLADTLRAQAEQAGGMGDRVDSLATQVRILVAVLLFVVSPVYAAAIWSLVAHLVGAGRP